MVAAVTAAACVARSDRWVEASERERLVAWLADAGLLGGTCAREAAASFDLRLRQIEGQDGLDEAVATLRRIAGHPKARLVVACAEHVARADGVVRPSEDRILRLIRRTVRPAPAWRGPAA